VARPPARPPDEIGARDQRESRTEKDDLVDRIIGHQPFDHRFHQREQEYPGQHGHRAARVVAQILGAYCRHDAMTHRRKLR
jgi:hypothetical protein